MAKKPDDAPGAGYQPSAKDRRLVELSAAFGVPDDQVARALGIPATALRKLFERELARGDFRANSQVAESLFRQAVSGNATAAIWWSKARLGWTDPAHAIGERAAARQPKITVVLVDATSRGPTIEDQGEQVVIEAPLEAASP